MRYILFLLFFTPLIAFSQDTDTEKSVIEDFPADKFHLTKTETKKLQDLHLPNKEVIKIYRIKKNDETAEHILYGLKLEIYATAKNDSPRIVYIDKEKSQTLAQQIERMLGESDEDLDFSSQITIPGAKIGLIKTQKSKTYYISLGDDPKDYIKISSDDLNTLVTDLKGLNQK